MNWWQRLWRNEGSSGLGQIRHMHLTLPGWQEEAPSGQMRVWRDAEDSVVSLASVQGILAENLTIPGDVQKTARNIATGRGAGLIEAYTVTSSAAHAVRMIYKRLERAKYIYTGMLIVLVPGNSFAWTVVAGERGTTGEREALVTATLINAGHFTMDDYRNRFAQDPYDPSFKEVERSVLRFMSDDESYDEQFPFHPLTKVRRILTALSQQGNAAA